MPRENFGLALGRRLGGCGFLCLGLLFFSSLAWATLSGGDSKTWQVLSELSEEELARIDLSPKTPRDPEISYLPAEPYPFTPPYTAEEMGYRAMEFPHMPRWSCVQIEDGGVLTPSGYLSTIKVVVLVDYRAPEGLVGQLTAKPGEVYSRWLTQDIAPPENYGNQLLFITYRTDQTASKKADLFGYSPALRRVRRFPQPRRQERLANWPLTYDDSVGRDAWEFSWHILGTDVLYETVRFPKTRRIITLASADGSFTDVPVDTLKLMGEEYSHYTPDGGVKCYVVEARPKAEWLPDYYAPRILYWLDQHAFYPLRIEIYGKEGKPVFLEERMAKLMNPRLQEQGYHNLIAVWWDVQQDFYGYSVHDAQELREWSEKDLAVFFSPDFMRRGWFPAPLKTQAAIRTPEEFFLRPRLHREKFPQQRKIVLPADLEARIQAQEAAGRIVFIESLDESLDDSPDNSFNGSE
jgi:hypothetical protein